MTATVRVPTTLRTLTAGASEVQVEGGTVGQVLDSLEAAHPGFKERLMDDDGGLRRFVNVFVADDDVRFLKGMDTPVPDGDTVSIIPAVAGGEAGRRRSPAFTQTAWRREQWTGQVRQPARDLARRGLDTRRGPDSIRSGSVIRTSGGESRLNIRRNARYTSGSRRTAGISPYRMSSAIGSSDDVSPPSSPGSSARRSAACA